MLLAVLCDCFIREYYYLNIITVLVMLNTGETDVGYLTLRPGTQSSITVMLLNTGNSQRFSISISLEKSIDDAQVQYTVDNDNPVVSQNSKERITINVIFPSNIPPGLGVTFTVVAQSDSNSDINDFINFDVASLREVSINMAISTQLYNCLFSFYSQLQKEVLLLVCMCHG